MLFFRPKLKAVDLVIVGLGNPGPKYAQTRHNLGFEVLNRLSKEWSDVSEWTKAKEYLSISGKRKGKSYLLIKPTTYMNLSGKAVRDVTRKYEFDIDQLIVVHDELDVLYGKVKVKTGGSAAGHNGVASIAGTLGDKGFHRLKLGIGIEGFKGGQNYLLEQLNDDEWHEFDDSVKLACEGLDVLIEKGITEATQFLNTNGKHLGEPEEGESVRDGN